MTKQNGQNTKEPNKPTANEILAKGGLTAEQIASGRLNTVATGMARDTWIAQLIITSGIEAWEKLMPDTPKDVIRAWAKETLKLARHGLKK